MGTSVGDLTRRRRLTAWATAAVLMLGMTGCAGQDSPESSPADSSTKSGGVVTVAAGSDIPSLDPVRMRGVGGGTDQGVQVMDTLLSYDEVTGSFGPKLAQSIDSEDARTWVLGLREGVTFTDGEPLDADAVVFNVQRHMAPDSPSVAKGLLADVASIEATGEYEVTITLNEPSGSFPLVFSWASTAGMIGSPKALADPEKFGRMPVGAGPFMLESWTVDDRMVMVKNDDYWDEGKPYLDGVTYVVLPDPQTRVDELVAGGVNSAQVASGMWPRVNGDSTLVLRPVDSVGTALVSNGSKGATSDQRVRDAISMAFDGETTANVIFGGTEFWNGERSCIPFPSESPLCVEGSANEQDVDAASELVESFVTDGGDPTIELVYIGVPDQAVYIQQQLGEIGLDITLRSVDIATYFAAEQRGDYEMMLATTGLPEPLLWGRLYSGATNWGQVAYPDVDAALITARNGVTLEERTEGWRDAVQAIQDHASVVWLYPWPVAMGYSADLRFGEEGDSYPGTPLAYFDQAWFDQ